MGAAALGAVATALPGSVSAAKAAAEPKSRSVRDEIWLFTTPPGSSNNHLELGGFRGGSRMTPAEGAFYLGIQNLILVRNRDLPSLPSAQSWRARTEYQQYATAFRPLKKVVWSIVGSQGKGSLNEVPYVRDLAKDYPNIIGAFVDDFIIDSKKLPDGRRMGRPALSLQDVKAARAQLRAGPKPLEFWLTLYTNHILPDHPTYSTIEPGIEDFVGLFDVLTLWTWNGNELKDLEKSMAGLERLSPRGARKGLGLYMWDYPNRRPMPIDLMKLQCETGLRWLREGRIQHLIFLSSTLVDMGLDSVEWARNWIREVGDTALSS